MRPEQWEIFKKAARLEKLDKVPMAMSGRREGNRTDALKLGYAALPVGAGRKGRRPTEERRVAAFETAA